MINYEFGKIVLTGFSYSHFLYKKKRPALVVLDIGDADIVLAPITTKERGGKGDLKLLGWKKEGLLRESWVRLAKISCLSKTDIISILGKLTEEDGKDVTKACKQLYEF